MCFDSNICWKLGKLVIFSDSSEVVCKMIEVQGFKRERDALLNWLWSLQEVVKFMYSDKTIRIWLSKLQLRQYEKITKNWHYWVNVNRGIFFQTLWHSHQWVIFSIELSWLLWSSQYLTFQTWNISSYFCIPLWIYDH